MGQLEQNPIAESAAALLADAGEKPCYGVVGNPIGHSLSPALHTAFAQQFENQISYGRLLLAPEKFEQQISAFFEQGGCGLNVTVPFKGNAHAMCDQLTPDAALAGAVNTLWQADSQLWGDNTDGRGLVQDLLGRCGLNLADAKVLILGAGGAVQGVIAPLFKAGVAQITLANRTRAKADALVAQFAEHGHIQAIDAGAAGDVIGYDLVIQGTGAGLTQSLPALNSAWFTEKTVCYDMMYADEPTPFIATVRAQFGVQSAWDGLGMLLEQAALAFDCWRDQQPNTAPVMQMLRPDA